MDEPLRRLTAVTPSNQPYPHGGGIKGRGIIEDRFKFQRLEKV